MAKISELKDPLAFFKPLEVSELNFKVALVYFFAYKAKNMRGVIINNLGGRVQFLRVL